MACKQHLFTAAHSSHEGMQQALGLCSPSNVCTTLQFLAFRLLEVKNDAGDLGDELRRTKVREFWLFQRW